MRIAHRRHELRIAEHATDVLRRAGQCRADARATGPHRRALAGRFRAPTQPTIRRKVRLKREVFTRARFGTDAIVKGRALR